MQFVSMGVKEIGTPWVYARSRENPYICKLKQNKTIAREGQGIRENTGRNGKRVMHRTRSVSVISYVSNTFMAFLRHPDHCRIMALEIPTRVKLPLFPKAPTRKGCCLSLGSLLLSHTSSLQVTISRRRTTIHRENLPSGVFPSMAPFHLDPQIDPVFYCGPLSHSVWNSCYLVKKVHRNIVFPSSV